MSGEASERAQLVIKTVEYVGTLAKPDGQIPGTLPQVAFSGRSNVGKSSLINTLLRRTRSRIARVSATPGKTQLINFFSVNELFYLVDLPGFGYARVPMALKKEWRGLIEGYLAREDGPVGMVHLVDCRRPPTEQDYEMLEFLAGIEMPTIVALTKIDKLKASQRAKTISDALVDLKIDRDQLVPFSSVTSEGRDELLNALTDLLGVAPEG